MKTSLMNSLFVAALAVTYSSAVLAASAAVDIKLTPAGGFTGRSEEVKGAVKKVGNKFVGDNIVVNLKALKTGMGLRDKHTQDHLETAKFPEAILVHAEGENGKGKGTVKIRGIEKPVEGTYKVTGKDLTATFPIKLSDFGISGIRYMGIGVKDAATINVIVPVQ